MSDYTNEQFRAWGAEGGRKRAARLSKKRRKQIARAAAKAMWAKKKNGSN